MGQTRSHVRTKLFDVLQRVKPPLALMCTVLGSAMWGSQKQSGPSGAEQEKEQAVCPSDRVKHAKEAREKKKAAAKIKNN